MNTTLTNTNGLPHAGNNEINPILEELREVYLHAGLPYGNALAAAIADYADLFFNNGA